MAGMTTTLTEFANYGNSRTSTLSTHTASFPKLVIEKRRVPEGNQSVVEYSFKVVEATVDADGVTLAQKVTLEAVARYPVLSTEAAKTTALATFRDIVAGDEFGASFLSSNWLT